MLIEQRKNRRFDLKLPLAIILARTKQKHTGETRNLSSSGVLFTSQLSFKIGQPIECLIKFPTAPGSGVEIHLHCRGKVLRKDAESTFAATLVRHKFLRGPSSSRRRPRKGHSS